MLFGSPALIVHLVPLRRAAHEILSGADILVAATTVSVSATIPSPSILSGLFDLTPAEARLAIGLTSGRSVQEAVAAVGIAVKSARTYLERIFRKNRHQPPKPTHGAAEEQPGLFRSRMASVGGKPKHYRRVSR